MPYDTHISAEIKRYAMTTAKKMTTTSKHPEEKKYYHAEESFAVQDYVYLLQEPAPKIVPARHRSRTTCRRAAKPALEWKRLGPSPGPGGVGSCSSAKSRTPTKWSRCPRCWPWLSGAPRVTTPTRALQCASGAPSSRRARRTPPSQRGPLRRPCKCMEKGFGQ